MPTPLRWRLILADLGVRVYALSLFALLAFVGYLSVTYLIHYVFFPYAIPTRLLEWQGRLDVAALRSPDAPGVTEDARRAPMTHFHRVERWYQVDPYNGCTVSGCHQPLPHTAANAKVPAFANFHTTFLTCRMCHQSPPTSGQPEHVAWISTATGKPVGTPAILQLLKYLSQYAQQPATEPSVANATISPLLKQAIADLGGDSLLEDIQAQIDTSEPGSPVWKSAIGELSGELPLRARGEYRAKLARGNEIGGFVPIDHADINRYLSLPPHSPQRQALHAKLHADVNPHPVPCIACHASKPGMIDFAAIGFSPQRAAMLSDLELARLMQRIRQGESFYLPNVMEGARNDNR
jgi:hypothetical protein